MKNKRKTGRLLLIIAAVILLTTAAFAVRRIMLPDNDYNYELDGTDTATDFELSGLWNETRREYSFPGIEMGSTPEEVRAFYGVEKLPEYPALDENLDPSIWTIFNVDGLEYTAIPTFSFSDGRLIMCSLNLDLHLNETLTEHSAVLLEALTELYGEPTLLEDTSEDGTSSCEYRWQKDTDTGGIRRLSLFVDTKDGETEIIQLSAYAKD